MPAILAPARRQVNAQRLLREVQAAEDVLEAGVGAQEKWRLRDEASWWADWLLQAAIA